MPLSSGEVQGWTNTLIGVATALGGAMLIIFSVLWARIRSEASMNKEEHKEIMRQMIDGHKVILDVQKEITETQKEITANTKDIRKLVEWYDSYRTSQLGTGEGLHEWLGALGEKLTKQDSRISELEHEFATFKLVAKLRGSKDRRSPGDPEDIQHMHGDIGK